MSQYLTTERLVMRPPEPRDETAYVTFYGSDRRAVTTGRVPADVARTRFAGVCAHWQTKGFGRFIVEDALSGDTLGLIGPHHPEDYPEAELAWHLWTDTAEGKGIAHEAAEAARAHAYGALGFETIVSYIRPENIRSIKLAERLGAQRDEAADYPTHLGLHYAYRHPAPGGTS